MTEHVFILAIIDSNCYSLFVPICSASYMATHITAISDPITGIDDSTTNTTEVSEAALPHKLSLQNRATDGDRAPLPSELPPDMRTKDEHLLLKEAYEALRGVALPDRHRSFAVIPRFYHRPPREESALAQKLREEARSRFLKERSTQLLDNQEVQQLLQLLEKRSKSCSQAGYSKIDMSEQLLNYDEFIAVGKQSSAKSKPFFQPAIFARLYNGDPYGRISVASFFTYIMRKVWLHQTRIGLSIYDVQGQGYLRETDLENYIIELIPTLPQLECLEISFYSFYVCTAVRKFFFFLDPMRTGRIKIQDILASSFLDELLELRDEDLPKEMQFSNWFSATSALRVYGQYLALDRDHNGMLSLAELSHYAKGTLTQVFLQQLFQQCLTYEGEMDYKAYLDFVLAMENRKETQALQYFFRILDINNDGYLHLMNLSYFFRGIQSMLNECGHDHIKFEDVQNEIFDMVKPSHPWQITLQDLIKSGQGETVINILIDLDGFWTYENRENILAENQDADF